MNKTIYNIKLYGYCVYFDSIFNITLLFLSHKNIISILIEYLISFKLIENINLASNIF